MPEPPRAGDATRTYDFDPLGARASAAVDDAGLLLLYAPEPHALPHVVPLSPQSPLVIGREPPAGGLAIVHTAVSRVHARVHRAEGGWTVTDLDSRNGTLVDGFRVSEAVLDDRDELRIGDAIFVFLERGITACSGHRIDAVLDEPFVAGPRTRRVMDGLRAVARSDLTILILGETGTGKEVAARLVHDASGRRGRFAALNSAAMPTQIMESELFGHRRGAFTGADRDKPGLIAVADGGSLFLDEIGDLAPEAQAKLLRVLETGEILALGATHAERVDVRFIAATHRNLKSLVDEGKFRGDLFARLQGHVAELPPLRARKEELIPLLRFFLAKLGRPRAVPSTAFAAAVCHYDWPYNVRELESSVKRAVALLDAERAPADGLLELRHLPEAVVGSLAGYGEPAPAKTAGGHAPPPDADALREALVRHHGNVAAVARELGKDRVQIHRWMKKHGIDPSDFR